MKPRKILCALVLLFISSGVLLSQRHYIFGRNDLIPEILWTRGCTPTAASMVLMFYDHLTPIGIMGVGGKFFGQLVDYYRTHWDSYKNVPFPLIDELHNAMGTDDEGGTYPANYDSGISYVTNTINHYSFSVLTSSLMPPIWHWNEIVNEINNNRPFMWNVWGGGFGHSLCAYGYTDSKQVIVRDTWWPETESSWYYDQYNNQYPVANELMTYIIPDGGSDSTVIITDPIGGESLLGNSNYTIWWHQWGTTITDVQILLSIDDGASFPTWITTSSVNSYPGWNSYNWTVPNINASHARIWIKGGTWSTFGKLAFWDEAKDGSYRSFTITYVGPNIRTPIQAVDFGSAPTGWVYDKVTTIYNDGNATLTVNSITRTSGSTEFTYVGPATPFYVAPGGSRDVTLRFAPATAGAQTAVFTVNSDDSDTPNATFNANGTGGTFPDIRTPIGNVNFGYVSTGGTLDRTTIIYNDGNTILTVNSITKVTIDPMFSFVGPSTPFNIAAGGSQVVTVRFHPTSIGTEQATFAVSSNDPDEGSVYFNAFGSGVVSYSIPFSESFTGATIPASWATQNEGAGIMERWGISATTYAGGQPNEMICTWQYVNPGTTRLVTPPLITTGYSILNLSFKHFFDDYASGALLKIQTSTDGMTWTDETWSLASGGGNKGPETINTTISHNLNSIGTYIAFVVDGNLYDIDYWYIDDVAITVPTSSLFFQIPFNALNNGNVDLGNISGATANVTLRGLNSSGAIVFEQGTTIPAMGAKRSWDILGNIYSYGKPLTVKVDSDQALTGDNIKWADPPYDTVGAGFTCAPVSQMKGTLFYFPFSSFGSVQGYAAISNTTSSTANITVQVFDAAGVLKKTAGMTVGPKGVARTWESLGNIATWADPALVKIVSDQDIVVEAVRWEQNKRGWGFAIFPSAIASGTSFLIPFNALNNGNVNLGNIGGATANVTLNIWSAAGAVVKTQGLTIPSMGVKRTWDIIGDIYDYGKPVTVEVTSDQALVGDNIKWADPPYDTVGAGFSCAPVSLMKGKTFYFPFSSFGAVQAYAAISNATSSTANITIQVYDATGALKKTQGMTVGSRGVGRTYDTLGNIATWADPALVKITSDQDVVVEAVRWEQNKRGWGFAILPIL